MNINWTIKDAMSMQLAKKAIDLMSTAAKSKVPDNAIDIAKVIRKYLYAVLVYAVCIPGIFAVALSVYQFMFGRRDILNADVLAQVLPIGSMLLTLGIIGRNASFSAIPGFGRLSGLMTMIAAVFVLMYILDRLHIVAFVRLPVEVLLVVVVGALLMLRFAFGRLMA
jgi:hypothetical protein